MSNSITPADDYQHIPDEKLEWRESYYFNFVSHDRKTSGFTTIGVLPNQKREEFVLALIHEDKQTIYFKEQEQSRNPLSNNTLTFELVEPMQRWKIDFSSEDLDLKIRWKARFPPLDFGRGSGTSWRGHFEQSGVVKGELSLPDGGKSPVEGYSQRDKSWGSRDWHIEKWFALHAQFGTYAIGLRRDTVSGIQYISGGLSSAEKPTPASLVDVEMMYEEGDSKNPTGALTSVRFADGKVTVLRSRLVSPKSFVKFSRDFQNGSTELFEGMAIHECVATGEKGTGLIESLFTKPKP